MLVSDRAKALEVVKTLSDEYSRKIVLAVIKRSLPIGVISTELHIPISTCYRRIHELASYGIIRADRSVIQEDGKKYICYKASFKSASIQLESGELKVDLISNREPEDKLHDIWQLVKGPKNSKIEKHEVRDAPSSSIAFAQESEPMFKNSCLVASQAALQPTHIARSL